MAVLGTNFKNRALMQTALKIVVGTGILFLLIAIRVKENDLFYDPLINFFKSEHSSEKLPDFIFLKLIANVALRYLMNTLLSIALLWILFKRTTFIKLASFLYVVLFVVLLVIFCILLLQYPNPPHHFLFYVRRFLIQPIFLLILVPAFYFQVKKQ